MVIKLPSIPIGLNYESDMTSLSGSTIVFIKGQSKTLYTTAKKNLSTCKFKCPKPPDFKS